MQENMAFTIPAWVPEGAQRYLAHTETGQSIRDIARSVGCHASTILRQIRRIEMRRDDPLVDAALQALAEVHFTDQQGRAGSLNEPLGIQANDAANKDDEFNREALRILRRPCETGAVLAVVEEMDKAVVVRDSGDSGTARTAVVDCTIARLRKRWL
ncbi:hypothetical protein RUA4292_02439 [Ruegeria atlantica]|uniref:Uncharacterized protein n=1 Tax=Ruegeria atlantica TaxID=81569 RepID=A0A0P1EEC2_9RHOB|nr:hypothetical protein RUA4292_02439 [Ruegeria atlantica]